MAGSVSRRLTTLGSGGSRVIASAALANLGDGIRHVALPLLVVSITREPVAVSTLTAVSFLPWVLLGLPLGAYVDRSSPVVVAARANIGRAVLLAALSVALLAGDRSLALLFVVVFLLGVGEAAYDNAAQSLLPQVVADAALERANGTLAVVEQAGLDLAGPALGGLIFATSAALPFGLNAAGLLIGAALIARIPVARRPATGRRAAGWAPVREFLSEVPAGLRWLWRTGFVRSIILTGAGLTFFTQMWQPLLVLLALGPMGLSKTGYGVMLALGAIGGVAGAAATPLLVRRFEHRVLQVLALVATSAGVLALAAFPTPVVAALAWGDTGFTFALWNVLSVTMRQRLVPPGLLGRVNSASRTLSTTAVPLGALAGGAVADVLGLRAAFWLSGLAVAVLAVTFRLTRRGGRPPAHVALRHDDPMQPNLARIPAGGDARARAILRRAQGTISQQFLDTLDDRDCLDLGRYGTRQPTVALRNGSAALLRDALLAAALGQLGQPDDPRDLMVRLALHHIVAQRLGLAAPDLFSEIAARLPDGPTPDLLRVFGARQDVTLEAFRWQLVQTPEGPDFIPA